MDSGLVINHVQVRKCFNGPINVLPLESRKAICLVLSNGCVKTRCPLIKTLRTCLSSNKVPGCALESYSKPKSMFSSFKSPKPISNN